MSMDIAQIGFKVDSTGIKEFTQNINLAKLAAGGLDAKIDNLTATIQGVGKGSAGVRSIASGIDSVSTSLRTAQVSAMKFDASMTAALGTAQRLSKTMLKSNVIQFPTVARDERPNKFNTANIAAQFQDIGVTAAMGMNPMTIAIQQGTQLAAIMNSMHKPMAGIVEAFKSVFNWTSLLSIGLVGLVAAGIQFVDWISVAKGLLNGLADAVEVIGPYIIGLAATLALLYAPTILAGLKSLTLQLLTVGTAALKAGAQMAGAWLVAIGPIGWVILAIAGIVTAMNIFRDEMKTIFGIDIVESVKVGVNKMIGTFVGFFEGIVSAAKNIPDALRGEGISFGEAFSQGFRDGFERDYVGGIADVVNNATSDAADKLRSLATGINVGGKKKGGKTEAERFEDIVAGAERTIASLKAEQAALGLTSYEALRLKNYTDLLNDAQQKNITLTDRQKVVLGQLADTMTATAESTRKTKEAIDFAKGATQGFVSDMRSGLEEGKSLWESFGNAVQNVLDKILDKMIDLAIDDMFAGAGGGGGAGGILSSIAGWLFNAKGNAFGPSGVQAFANGGAFTNSVVNKPTMFASGGALGVMGEAGPEAIMPLHRGSDGSLGVRMEGGGGGQVIVNIQNNSSGSKASVGSQRNTSNGLEIDVMIDDVVSSKLGDRGSSTNRALETHLNRQMIQR